MNLERLPRATGSHARLFDRASIALLLGLFVLAIATFRDFGITHDESFHLAYGTHIVKFFGSGFEDQTAVTFRIDYLYGGGFDMLGAIFREFAKPLDRYDGIHLFGCLIGVLGIVGTWKLGRQLGGPRAGLLAAVMMATTSVYYGHMFNNPKDLPFAAGYAWGLYYLSAVIQSFPRVPWSLAAKCMVAMGLAMSVRIGGILLICYLGLAVILWVLHRAWTRRSAEVGYSSVRQISISMVAIIAGAWATMLIWWPWALYDPIRRPLAALRRMSQFIDHRRHMPFNGESVYNLDPPWDYLIHYFGYKLPEYLVILGVTATLVGLVYPLFRRFAGSAFSHRLALFIVGLSIWLPPSYAIYKGSPLYDGLRHFLFLVPPIVAISAVLVDRIFALAGRRFAMPGLVACTAVMAALVTDQATTMVRYHPHQVNYFNRFIGGLKGAVGKYDTDYYAESFKESCENLSAALWKEEPKIYLNSMYEVSGCLSRGKAERYLPANFRWRKNRGSAQFMLGYTRGNCAYKHKQHPVISTVTIDGGLLNLARDLRRTITKTPAKKRGGAAHAKRPGPVRGGDRSVKTGVKRPPQPTATKRPSPTPAPKPKENKRDGSSN